MSIKRNIVANYFGRGWRALMLFCFIPLYIHFLGIEAYGVIGLFSSLGATLAFLDFGLSQTLSREAARCGCGGEERENLCALVGTLEYVYWGIAFFAAVSIWFMAKWLSVNWLHSESIASSELAHVISIMGLVASLQWVGGIYRSTLIGLQDQVWLNLFEGTFATLRGLGVVAVLMWVSPTVEAFFVYQGVVAFLEIVLLRCKVWRSVAPEGSYLPRFYLHHLQRIWQFASGVAVISVLGASVSQFDKLILPGIVSLKVFGYYMIANVLGRSIAQLAFPVVTAYRPVFARLVADGNDQALVTEYHRASQVMAVSIIPLAFTIAIFSSQILWLWTGDKEIMISSATIVTLLTIGTMFNGLVNIPYSIQLAYGWVKPGIYINVVAALLLVPSLIFGVKNFGTVASGWVWFSLNLGYVVIHVVVTHRRYLVREAWDWYLKDILPVMASSFVVICLGMFLPDFNNRLYMCAKFGVVLCAALCAAITSAAHMRHFFVSRFFTHTKVN